MNQNRRSRLAKALTSVEDKSGDWQAILRRSFASDRAAIVGVTGPPGSGKSTLIDGLAAHWASAGEDIAIVCVDPSSPFSGGAVLGDRARMRRCQDLENVFIRSMSARGHSGGLNEAAIDVCAVISDFGVTRVLLETVGAGQSEADVGLVADCVVVVAVPGLGDALQAGKAGVMEIGDIHVVNKADLPGASGVARDVESMVALAFAGSAGRNNPQPGHSGLAAASRKTRGRLARRYGAPDGTVQFWRPPVLTATATQSNTVAAIATAIDDCLAWLEESGRGIDRRSDRAKRHLREIVQRQLLDTLLGPAEAGGGPIEQWAARVSNREVDPYAAADAVLRQVAGSWPVHPVEKH